MAGVYWREAASLIVIGKQSQKVINLPEFRSLYCNYDVLFLKRSNKSRFMPTTHVFPGGAFDLSDASEKWVSYYERCGHNLDQLQKSFRKNELLKFGKFSFKHELPEFAFRICALRETFEETGLLLSRNASGSQIKTCVSDSSLKEWRRIVHDDAKQFLNLHEELSTVPDVWSLLDWDSWLTPTFYGEKNKRFDTFFYITFLDDGIPDLVHDNKENVAIYNAQPIEQCASFYNEEIMLAPPQLYQMGRFLRYTDYEELKKFSIEREQFGMNRWMPVHFGTQDGFMTILEGDALQPNDFELNPYKDEGRIEQETLEDSRNRCFKLNRIEFHRNGVFPVVNQPKDYKHITPTSLMSIFWNRTKL